MITAGKQIGARPSELDGQGQRIYGFSPSPRTSGGFTYHPGNHVRMLWPRDIHFDPLDTVVRSSMLGKDVRLFREPPYEKSMLSPLFSKSRSGPSRCK
jgi:hypothetical protein